MSHANPTALRPGLRGTFENQEFQIAGRVVMSMDDGGETYYWNEFNLVSPTGLTATLAYEEGEHGGEWRLFTLFEPDYPLTAADAAAKRIGDRLNLTETEVRVTLRDQSRVRFIEGQAPEGVEIGDVADYFNAEAPGVMQVVSWTGDEVECYNGIQLTAMEVQRAFNLSRPAAAAPLRNFSSFSGGDSGEYLGTTKFLIYAVVGVFLFLGLFGGALGSCSFVRRAAPARHVPAGPPPLALGMEGRWHDGTYRVAAHALMEVGTVDTVFQRHEYLLAGPDGSVALLLCGLNGRDTNWYLGLPIAPFPAPSPSACAALTVGETVNLDGLTGTISTLFQCTPLSAEQSSPSLRFSGPASFGYLAPGPGTLLLVRWDASMARFYRLQKAPVSAGTFGFK